MVRSGVRAPGFLTRLGNIVDRRRDAEFKELKADSLLNRLTVRREFPWALPRYLEFFSRPGSAPPGVRDGIERLVAALAREAGFTARSREARVRDEAPARPRQLSLVW